jgi:hypothetical protein
MPSRSRKGAAVVETMVAAFTLLLLLSGTIQVALLLAGRSAVETAAHFAARTFALKARNDYRKAREASLAEASRLCLQRPGASLSDAGFTTIDLTPENNGHSASCPLSGDAYVVRLRHGIELSVPFVDRVIYAVAPTPKMLVGDRRYLLFESARRVAVE